MKGNLVIVESPTKARKIQGYLGEDYTVKFSRGHIRDLQENALSIDTKDNFAPQYVIPADKVKLVADLKKEAKKASMVLLASDEDREGEAIAWHLSEVLELDKAKTKRITFHEITKSAILEGLENPRDVDMNLVDAQQARRVLDRLVGFELSPVLWKKIQPKLSAGRVQSVALRLIVDKEREIMAFKTVGQYKVDAMFTPEGSDVALKATLNKRFDTKADAYAFLEKCIGATFTVSDIKEKEGTRTPAAPFTTSTLQQEAARKFGFSVNQTMQIAQKLYEEGLITYMRTDSVTLSGLAINTAKTFILDNFGPEYSKPRQYKTKNKGAQEAHEAIRPTYIQNADITGNPNERRLYQLIWKRTVASQMADADILSTAVEISGSNFSEKFNLEAAKVRFDGFLKLYMESTDDVQEEESTLNVGDLAVGKLMLPGTITAECKFTSAPARYNQASLVDKLEKLGIGRPSTYASIISTLVKGRGYVVEGDKEGTVYNVENLKLSGSRITETSKKEKVGAEKRRLLPQDIGIMVSDYLVEHFPDVVDYSFTANVEKDFDEIAEGKLNWSKVINDFYTPFHSTVKDTMSNTGYSRLEKEIGIDPSDGQLIIAKYGQYGPFVQKGEGDKKVYASLAKGQIIESLTLEDAVKLFQLPRTLGEIDGTPVVVTKGRFGAYIKFGTKNVSLPRNADPMAITLEAAQKILASADEKPAMKVISQWGDIQLIEGSYGPFIKAAGVNYRIPKGTDAYTLKEEDVKNIIANSEPTAKKRSYFKKK